jgi:hypothetical protein
MMFMPTDAWSKKTARFASTARAASTLAGGGVLDCVVALATFDQALLPAEFVARTR